MEIWVRILVLMAATGASYSADECSWRGSGLSRPEQGVEQVFLRCAEGSVEFLYPTGALRLTLLPRLSGHRVVGGASGTPSSVCVKPEPQWGGAQLYLERSGILQLLVSDTPGSSHIRCFSIIPGESPALFLQATPHGDISRRIAAFRYELRGDWTAGMSVNSVDDDAAVDIEEGACRPCNDTEMLMAVCISDFVVRGNIRAVDTDPEQRVSVIRVSATRVYRQKWPLFSSVGRLTHSGQIRTSLRCGVRSGTGSFLFTGHAHFGDAWLTCAPRYKDFLRVYERAKRDHQIPCTLDT